MTVEREQKYLHIRIPLLLILAIGALFYEIWIFVVYQRAYSDQTGVFFGPQLVVEQVFPGSLFHTGDSILKIDDLDVNGNLLTPFYWLRQFAERQSAGQSTRGATYTVLRAGREQHVYVTWESYRTSPLLWRGGALWLIGLVMNVVALVLVTGKGRDLATRLISLDFIVAGLNQINNLIRTASANMAVAWAWFFIPLDAISIWLTFSLLLHALLLFPEMKAPLRRFPWLPWVIHFFTPVISIAAGLLFGGGTLLGRRNAMFAVANPLMMVQLALAVAALTHTYLTSRRPGVRNQIRWIILGLILALIPWILFYALPSLFFNVTWLPLSIANLPLLLVPVAFMVSIFRFGLMDVDRFMNRTLVYALTGGTLVLLYFLVLLVAGDLLPPIAGQPNHFWAGIIATVVLFAVFNPLRIHTEQFVNRVFYKEQLDFAIMLRDVGRQLSATVVQDDVYNLLTHDVSQRLGLTSARILLPNDGRCAYIDRENTMCIPSDSLLVPWLCDHRDPLVVQERQRLPEDIAQTIEPLVTAGCELCLALMQRSTLLGIYVFGAKNSGDLFTREEVNNLDLLGHQAAAALYNAQLYETLQDYNRSLEVRVAERTSQLEAERDRLDTIIQNITDALVVTDPAAKIVLANSAFADIVGRPVDQLFGIPLATVLSSESLALLIETASDYPGQVQTQNMTGEVLGGRDEIEGKVYKVSACGLVERGLADPETPLPATADANTSGVITVLQDITHEQAVDRMKTDFISMVSHELRTPLTSVIGFVRLIQKMFEQELVSRIDDSDRRGRWAMERITENLKIIIGEGDRLTRLINDVLDIAKMESGKSEWSRDVVPFQEIIDTAVNGMQTLSLQKNLPIRVDVQNLPPVVTVDRDRMVQVMTNLLGNALKFTAEGEIVVRACCIDGHANYAPPALRSLKTSDAPDLWLWVRVEDTGIGIPAEKFSQVFEKFKQISGDSHRLALGYATRGTGLGLPICREIVEQHGGRIWVESTVGVGSTFSFVIPVEEQEAIALPLSPSGTV
ncbi:MAG: PAS domain-containing protein [Anaerolineae bacterium]|nr:PAS domain-containing protein [Anaerolineae bacterium]